MHDGEGEENNRRPQRRHMLQSPRAGAIASPALDSKQDSASFFEKVHASFVIVVDWYVRVWWFPVILIRLVMEMVDCDGKMMNCIEIRAFLVDLISMICC